MILEKDRPSGQWNRFEYPVKNLDVYDQLVFGNDKYEIE